jgi:glycerol kinase
VGPPTPPLVRAALEGIAYPLTAILFAVEANSGIPLKELRVDAEAFPNNRLLPFQADLLGIPVVRAKTPKPQRCAWLNLAGLAVGLYHSPDEIAAQRASDRTFKPRMPEGEKLRLNQEGSKALRRAKRWIDA